MPILPSFLTAASPAPVPPTSAVSRPRITPYIRHMVRRHLPEVLAIDAATVGPWSEDTFLRHLRQRNTIGMVAESDTGGNCPPILGYFIYVLKNHHIKLLRFVVHREFRNHGVGTAMLTKLTSKLSIAPGPGKRRPRAECIVRLHGLDMLAFLRSNAWLSYEIWHDYYEPHGDIPGDDAVRMGMDLRRAVIRSEDECSGR